MLTSVDRAVSEWEIAGLYLVFNLWQARPALPAHYGLYSLVESTSGADATVHIESHVTYRHLAIPVTIDPLAAAASTTRGSA